MLYRGFCGSSNRSQSAVSNGERTVNWYVEPIQSAAAQSSPALYPTPGVTALVTASHTGTRGIGVAGDRAFCVIGTYTVNNATFDLYLLGMFAAAGFVLSKLDCEPAPLLLGFVLGPLLEENFRRAMVLSRGDPSVFFTRPISAALLLVGVALLVLVLLPTIRSRREEVFVED